MCFNFTLWEYFHFKLCLSYTRLCPNCNYCMKRWGHSSSLVLLSIFDICSLHLGNPETQVLQGLFFSPFQPIQFHFPHSIVRLSCKTWRKYKDTTKTWALSSVSATNTRQRKVTPKTTTTLFMNHLEVLHRDEDDFQVSSRLISIHETRLIPWEFIPFHQCLIL